MASSSVTGTIATLPKEKPKQSQRKQKQSYASCRFFFEVPVLGMLPVKYILATVVVQGTVCVL